MKVRYDVVEDYKEQDEEALKKTRETLRMNFFYQSKGKWKENSLSGGKTRGGIGKWCKMI